MLLPYLLREYLRHYLLYVVIVSVINLPLIYLKTFISVVKVLYKSSSSKINILEPTKIKDYYVLNDKRLNTKSRILKNIKITFLTYLALKDLSIIRKIIAKLNTVLLS